MKKALWILVPSFVIAGLGELFFFVVFDPIELHIIGRWLGMGRVGAYSIGFLLFWVFAAASSGITYFLSQDKLGS
jgi:hypothetical protein